MSILEKLPIGVTSALAKTIKQSPHLFEELGACVRHYIKEYRRLMEALPGQTASWAYNFHNSMDELMEQAGRSLPPGIAVSCKRACSHCCYMDVHITPEEADLLIEYTKSEDIPVNWEQIEFQARYDRWLQMPYKQRRCAFLGESGECGVYKHRPMACRKYLVTGDPKFCNGGKYPHGQVDLLTANRAECMASAVYSMRGSDSMPKMILKRR